MSRRIIYAGVFCNRRKMSRRIGKKNRRILFQEENVQENRKKMRRILSWEEIVQENRKNTWEEYVIRIFCPGGYFPGGKCRFVCLGGKCLWRILFPEEKIRGEFCTGGKFGRKMCREENVREDSVTQSLFYCLKLT